MELESTNEELERVNAELAVLATMDGLTGLLNHRTFQVRLAEEVIRAARYSVPLSLVLLDVDHFKRYNDTFGHPAGDAVLRLVGAALRAEIRETDIVARYGGEEFALLLPQTSCRGAREMAERLRTALASCPWPHGPVTASFGIAALHPVEDSPVSLLERADAALYHSKTSVRNRVSVADMPSQEQLR